MTTTTERASVALERPVGAPHRLAHHWHNHGDSEVTHTKKPTDVLPRRVPIHAQSGSLEALAQVYHESMLPAATQQQGVPGRQAGQ